MPKRKIKCYSNKLCKRNRFQKTGLDNPNEILKDNEILEQLFRCEISLKEFIK